MKIYAIEYGYLEDSVFTGYYSTLAKAENALAELVAQGNRADLYEIVEIEVN